MVWLLSFAKVEGEADCSAHGSYFRTKSAGAQFKQMQKIMEKILQKFCFYPGGRRDKMIKNGSKRVMALGTTLSARKFVFCGRGFQPR
jgi:hypothetical protein